ncbi:MAG: HD domain-containing protein [Armatimonadetes bacterium]|nr:HD domain-containing protein [Armatimonadota bacterium]
MQAHRPGEILVVDGDSHFLSFAATTLQRRGHAVRVCAYAAEAREHVERHFFDAVLCSTVLPDSSGAEFCAWIKSHEDLQGLPVALLVEESQNSDDLIANLMRDAAPGSLQLSGPLAPDEFIVRTVRAEEFAIRVGGLLKLRRYREEIGNALTALLSVAAGVEEQDKRAAGHCKRLSIMAVLLGAALGCDEYQLLTLERAGYLHDIGKVAIPGAILEKVQPLTPREMEVIKEHCVLGERLCRPVAALQPVLPIIRHHHERGDGSGYPDRLKNDQIPRLAQLFSIVDVYDSLRTWRPYRPALNDWQAVDMLRNEARRGFWNQAMCETFARDVVPILNDHLDTSHVLWPTE